MLSLWVYAYSHWVFRRRWNIIIACFLAISAAALGLRQLEFTSGIRAFFGQKNPELIAWNALENTYTKTDSILFVLKPDSGDLFTPKTLRVIYDLTEESWKIPHSTRVDSITNFQHIVAEGDDLIVADLVDSPDELSEQRLMNIRRIALEEPSLVNRLVAADGGAAGVLVTLQLPGTDHIKHLPESVNRAEEVVENLRATHPNITVGLTGLTVMAETQARISKAELTTLVPIMFLIIVVSMLILLRSLLGTIATLLVIGMSVATAVGLSAWFGWRMNAVSAMSPIIILTLAVADCVHILATMFREMRKGRSKLDALIESLRVNAKAVFLTSLTTTIGFLSLNFSDTPWFHDLGNISAMGVVTAWILTMTFLPALVSILPLSPWKSARGIRISMEHFGEFLVRNRSRLLWPVVAGALIIIAFIPRLEFDDRWVQWFDNDVPLRVDTDFATANLVGPYMLEFSIESGEPGGISEPKYLGQLDAFSNWLRRQPEVAHVNSLVDVMKRLNMAMHGNEEEWYRLPEKRDLAAQYLLLFEMSLPFGLDLNSTVTVDKSATRLTATLHEITSNSIRNVARRAELRLKENAPSEMHSKATGMSIATAYITHRNISAMLKGTALAFVLISLTLVVALRNLRLGLISLIPNFLPIMVTFGLWGAFVGQMGIIASIITATSLGLIVDDTVHILSKYNSARREHNMSVHDAIRYVFENAGTALFMTTVILVVGFSVLGFSSYKINSDLGILTSVTLLSAIVFDFLLLTSLMMFIDKEKHCDCSVCNPEMAPVVINDQMGGGKRENPGA